MIRDDVRDLRRPRDAERPRLQQRAQRRLVLAEAELAEALHADRAGVRRLPRHQRREGVARFAVALALVERRSQVPAALVPVGAQGDPLAIERDRVVEASGFARRGRRRRDGRRRTRAAATPGPASLGPGSPGPPASGRGARRASAPGRGRSSRLAAGARRPRARAGDGRTASGSRRSTDWPVVSSVTFSTSS